MKPFNQDGKFESSSAQSQSAIRRLTLRGAGVTVSAGFVSLGIQVASTIVLARLLMPSDFGLVAMVTTFSLLLVNFGFNGLTEAIVQREEMDHDLASTVFWVNIGFGVLLTIGFAEAGSLLARLYHSPAVQQVAVGISFTIVCTSVSTVHLALVKRAMLFSWVSMNDVIARFASVIVSIVLGVMGWGYWALVAGAIAVPVSTAIGAWLLCEWAPSLPRKIAGTGAMLRFSLNAYGNFAVNYLSRNTDNLLVGWRFDATSLGFYKKAYDLFALSTNQLVSSVAIVVVSGLSRVKRDSILYRSYLLDAIGVMAFAGMGVAAILTVVGRDLILVLLGPKWAPAGEIFTYFGPGIGVMMLYGTHGWIHLSIGRPDRWFKWGILEFLVTCSLFLVALRWGPVGIATAWSVSFWLLTVPAISYAGGPIQLRASSVISTVWRYVVASVIAVLGGNVTHHILPFAVNGGIEQATFRIAVAIVVVLPLYLGGVLVLYGSLLPLRQVSGLVQEMLQRDEGKENEPQSNSLLTEPRFSSVDPENLPLVSILIPAYNAQEWIADTLRSAIAQTWPRTEIIVVDDGSRDRTVAVARQFEAQGVTVISQQNQGAAAARNNAYTHSHGDYIQWLDADDLLAPDKIARQMAFVLEGVSQRTLVSSPWGCFMYRPSQASFVPSALWCDLSPQEWLLRKMEQNIYMQTATWLVSRELSDAAGPWDTRMLGDDDGEYFCRVILACNGIRFVPDARVYYRTFRFDSLSYIGRFPKKIDAHWASMELHIKYLLSLGKSDRARRASMQFLRDSLIYFYPESRHILQRAEDLAASLGEPLGAPNLSWKYSWMESLFGWNFTKVAQHWIRLARWRFAKRLDYLMFMAEGRKLDLNSPVQNVARDSLLASLAAKETQIL